MITVGKKKEITALYVVWQVAPVVIKRAMTAAYKGERLLWTLVRSCFGLGYWKGDEPWNGTDAWNGISNE